MWRSLIRKFGSKVHTSVTRVESLSGEIHLSSLEAEIISKVILNCPPDSSIKLDPDLEGRGSITIKGSGNVVEFMKGCLFSGSIDIQGKNNRVTVGEGCAIRGRILVKGSKQTVSIGDRTTFQSVYLLCQENCNVIIGRWCMFSRDIEIRTTDAHSVVDSETGRRLNKPASVNIGDHVWLSVGVLISKGVTLPENSIVGANAFVNSSFSDSGTLIAGAPAKVVKRGVTWHRSRKENFTQDELNAWRQQTPNESETSIEEEL